MRQNEKEDQCKKVKKKSKKIKQWIKEEKREEQMIKKTRHKKERKTIPNIKIIMDYKTKQNNLSECKGIANSTNEGK